jgi:hypothetical protein
LRAAGIFQLICALLGCLMLLSYLQAPEELGRIPGWLCAPAGLVTAIFVLKRRRWAWYASLLLLPLYPLAPYFDVSNLKSSLHGGEVMLLLFIPIALVLAAIDAVLLVLGRKALLPSR